ncbi:hypothetical protein POM88_042410 [Heracleum sosnowskyi]|uniref:Uncharacterized protein n=1 Tax=Heracleum sosnowskyi TaxID=360622 RepID=A0AAD8HGM6_9APIA|nr:hypothetical protein POM88_042410 [Heracleum sosnowskyi]
MKRAAEDQGIKRRKKSRKRAESKDGDVTSTKSGKWIEMADYYMSSRKRAKSKKGVDKAEEEILQMSSSSKKGEEIVQMSSSPLTDDKESCFLGAGNFFDKSSEEDSEEEKKHVRRSPVYIKRFADRVKLEFCGIKVKENEPEEESDEELLRECDRNEVDHGYNYVLKKRFRAITNPINLNFCRKWNEIL